MTIRQEEQLLSARAALCGAGLRAIRERMGFGLRLIARSVPMNAGHLSRLERGTRGASMDVLRPLAKVYGFASVELMIARAERLARKAAR